MAAPPIPGAGRETFHLPDGRRLDYLDLGAAGGTPAMYLHGSPSSASEARWLSRHASDASVRLIALDRPGYLRSSAPPEATVTAVAADALALADDLGLQRFGIAGFSGGGGYALALGRLARDRATVIHLGGTIGSLADAPAGVGWPRRLMFRSVAGAPMLARPLLSLAYRHVARRMQSKLSGSAAEAARYLFDGPARGAQIEAVERYIATSDPDDLAQEIADYTSAMQATGAVIADVKAYARRWPFDPSDI
ncbi:MAG TPA: alpha/beta fold hydrolase, partial [Gaiellales bacterium]|nr:alpha/beta fold hydrolase [Gaiellales bacterium]